MRKLATIATALLAFTAAAQAADQIKLGLFSEFSEPISPPHGSEEGR
jgi:hypothetical protein